jgi:hypothetical protein
VERQVVAEEKSRVAAANYQTWVGGVGGGMRWGGSIQ